MKEPTTVDEMTLSLKASLRRIVFAECLNLAMAVAVIVLLSELFNLRESVRLSVLIAPVLFSAIRVVVSPWSRDTFYDGRRLYGPGFTGRVNGEIKQVRRYGTLSKWLRLRQKITTNRESIYLDPLHYDRAEFERFVARLRGVPSGVHSEASEAQSSV